MIETDKPPSPDSRELASIQITDGTGRLDARSVAWLREQARAAAGLLDARGEVRGRVVGDEEMARAHSRYKGLAGPTDVLTFDLSEGDRLDVDIMVCFGEAARQADLRGHSVERELLLYIVHGMLHCLGYDDHDAAGAARMHETEDRVLVQLGIGATYARPGTDGEDRN